jgi:hypothetical protein
VREASIGRLESGYSCTTDLSFLAGILVLPVTFDLFMLFTILVLHFFSVGFGVVGLFGLGVDDSFDIFFILQIQKHR